MKKFDLNRKTVERAIYIIVIIALAIYGLRDTEVAIRLIHAVKEAFTIILQ